MQEGKFGLFRNADGINCCNIRKGDKGITLEALLPPSMRGEAFAKAPVGAFLNLSYIFLATGNQWDEWWRDIKPGVQTKKVSPPLDVKALKLEDEAGRINYERLRDLYSLIWSYWDKKPPVGLIAHCIKWNVRHSEIARLLQLHDRYGDKIKDFDQCFTSVFLPPNMAEQGHFVTEEQLHYAFRWCHRPDGSEELKQESFKWELGFRELGIVSYLGVVNHKIARLARDFLWADPEREPDFFALKAHLASHLPKAERPTEKVVGGKVPKAYRDKLKKQQRKAGRIKRKR